MLPITIPNRPFATEFITGMMIPDGIFEATLGRQQINAHFQNQSASNIAGIEYYIESTSHPQIKVEAATKYGGSILANSASLQTWNIDVSNVPAGVYYVSFIAKSGLNQKRIIKKIFVTKVTFDPVSQRFSAATPEGVISASFKEIITSANGQGCGCKHETKYSEKISKDNPVGDVLSLIKNFDISDFKDCAPQTMLLKSFSTGVTHTPGFSGQYSDLPFQDPWWKVVLAILAVILFIVAIVVAAVFGVVAIVLFPPAGVGISATIACCSVPFFVAVGAAVAALVTGLIASESDARDPYRRGQDNTLPRNPDEITIGENVDVDIDYIEPIVSGTPFAIGIKWNYTRITRDSSNVERTYNYGVEEIQNNIHVLSRYEINAPDIVRVYKKEPFRVTGKFYDTKEALLRGSQLFVKCYLQRASDNKIISFVMQDDGQKGIDDKANDGTYTGIYYFNREEAGLWKIYVFAQDVNNAREDMEPEEAAQIIGGMLLTNQLTVDFTGGTCPLVADGDVNVIG
jgi:hypothetical protein